MSELMYRWLHFSSLFLFFASLGVTFFGDATKKWPKIVNGIAGVLIITGGMGLIVKGLNLSHGEGWPMWIKLKIVIWTIFTVAAPIAAKRLPETKKTPAYFFFVILAFVAAYLGVYK